MSAPRPPCISAPASPVGTGKWHLVPAFRTCVGLCHLSPQSALELALECQKGKHLPQGWFSQVLVASCALRLRSVSLGQRDNSF